MGACEINLDQLEKLADQVSAIIKNQIVSAEAVAVVRHYSAELNPDLIKALVNCARAVEHIAKTGVPTTEAKMYAVTKGGFRDCEDAHSQMQKTLLAMKQQSNVVTLSPN